MDGIKFIDLFAGIGGFHKGLQQTNNHFSQSTQRQPKERGNRNTKKPRTRFYNRQHPTFCCVWASEWNKYAAQIYKKQFPKTPIETRDIRLVKANDIPYADLLCAGFPCQPFSLAGKRKGFGETRGTLFYEILRIAKAKRIPYLLLENVKGLLSAQNGSAFYKILSNLDELGYCLQWQVLNSKDFGVPQNRERVFIIASLGKKRFKQIFPITRSDEENTGREGEKLMVYDGYNQKWRKGEGTKAIRTNEGCSTAGNLVTPTIRAEHHNTADVHYIPQNNRMRRLTPIECERLQGFPDNWTGELSDTQRYKCVGNAVTVNVIEAIGKKIMKVKANEQ